jgi:hypothetical protein
MKPLIGFVLAIAAAFAADIQPNMTKAEHKAEAARYATRAEESAAKARKHEANVERLAKPGYNAMQYKWPGLAKGPENLERERAAKARNVEAESRQKLAFHLEMAGKSVDAEP